MRNPRPSCVGSSIQALSPTVSPTAKLKSSAAVSGETSLSTYTSFPVGWPLTSFSSAREKSAASAFCPVQGISVNSGAVSPSGRAVAFATLPKCSEA